MVELFAQVWLLCAIAFLAGSAATWLLFVHLPGRRPSRARPAGTAPWAPDRAASRTPRPVRPEPAAPPPPVEPALARLDTSAGEPAARHAGSTAAGALDRLGVGGPAPVPDPPRPAPEIPAQGGPPPGGWS